MASLRHQAFRRRLGVLVLLATAAAGGSSDAHAARCVAPPGLSGIEQYCEMVPGADGDRPSAGEPGSRDGDQPLAGEAVPGGARRTLSRAGREGAAVLSLPAGRSGNRAADAGGADAPPGGAVSDRPSGTSNPGPGPSGTEADEGANFLGGLASSANEAADGGATGAPLPWILLGVALLVGAVAWIRRRPVA